MKIEIEIPDEEIQEAVKEAIKGFMKPIGLGGYRESVSTRMKEYFSKKIQDEMNNMDFGPAIENAVKERGHKEIERAIDEKVPGWIRRQVKEMLKYARAQVLRDNDNT